MEHKLLFLDTETTSLEDGRLVQLAFGETVDEKITIIDHIFKPPVPITIEAMAIHHITNEMANVEHSLKDHVCRNQSKYSYFFEEFQVTIDNSIIVAHNAKFDVEILRREGFIIDDKKVIDTKRLAQHLIDSPSYSLQYLRYYLKLELMDEAVAHNAVGDVVVLISLYEHLEKLINCSVEEKVDEFLKLTNIPVLLKTVPFGKWKGKTFEEATKLDRGYISWMYGQKDLSEDLEFTLRHYLNNF